MSETTATSTAAPTPSEAGAPSIAFNADAYGTKARVSAAADYVELSAIKNGAILHGAIVDLLKDNKCRLRDEVYEGEDFEPDEDSDDLLESKGEDAYRAGAARIFAVLEERQRILGHRYPFNVTESRLAFRKDALTDDSPYLALLAVAVAHANRLDTGVDVTRSLESLVVRSLEQKGLLAAGVGAAARGSDRDFEKTIAELSTKLGFPLNAKAAPRSRWAHDAGIDSIAVLPWGDDRCGRLSLIGQVTCEISDGWLKKLGEPSPRPWARRMKDYPHPFVFLALPYHVQPRQFRYLCSEKGASIVDRLRLALAVPWLDAPDRAVTSAVLAAGLEF